MELKRVANGELAADRLERAKALISLAQDVVAFGDGDFVLSESSAHGLVLLLASVETEIRNVLEVA